MRRIKPKITLYPHQMRYVKSKHRHPAIISGYGSGKTYANIQRILYLLEMRQGAGRIFYGAPTYDLISSSFLPEFLLTLETYGISHKTNKQEHTVTIREPAIAGQIKYLSFDNYKHLVAFNATDGILDEFDVIPYQRQKDIWIRALARLRGCEGATLSITSTPEGYKLCYELDREHKIELINASTRDNLSLPDSYLEALMENYDEPHQQLYINGQFVNLTGMRAIYAFNRGRVIKPIPADMIPADITVGIDFNVDPFCMTVSAMFDPKAIGLAGTKPVKVTFDEFYIRNMGDSGAYPSFTDKALNLLLNKYPTVWFRQNCAPETPRSYRIAVRPDMTGGGRKTAGNLTDLAIIKKYNLDYRGVAGLPVTNRLKVANVAMNTDRWFVTENCRELIRDLETVVVDQYGEITKSDQLRTHLLDAVTYDTYIEFKDLVFGERKATVI